MSHQQHPVHATWHAYHRKSKVVVYFSTLDDVNRRFICISPSRSPVPTTLCSTPFPREIVSFARPTWELWRRPSWYLHSVDVQRRVVPLVQRPGLTLIAVCACRAAAIAAQTLTPAHAICFKLDLATGPHDPSLLPKFTSATSDTMMPFGRLICRLAGSEDGTSQHVVPTLACCISLPCSVRLVLHMHVIWLFCPRQTTHGQELRYRD